MLWKLIRCEYEIRLIAIETWLLRAITRRYEAINHHLETLISDEKVVWRFGFKSKMQLPLFMIWREYWKHGDVEFADVWFTTGRWGF